MTGSACALHLTRGETSSTLFTAVLSVLLAFVAYQRWRVQPVPPRASTLTR